ncbi:hypothetical protein C2845_PM15G00830 [Panicum miliaceum]|uniref:Uncharacterized protein n=1 Tax=Panicum miliaceum TaxID=4540 RepID=A0A3L6QAG9_PANMI|nr:hypothetical protein C2845_PM15G00830 [Panicum miliaceum]
MPRKSTAGRGRKRENEGGEESPPPAKVSKTDNSPPQRHEFWLEKLLEEESHDIPELMKRIQALKAKGVTGESVAYLFIERRIHPL